MIKFQKKILRENRKTIKSIQEEFAKRRLWNARQLQQTQKGKKEEIMEEVVRAIFTMQKIYKKE